MADGGEGAALALAEAQLKRLGRGRGLTEELTRFAYAEAALSVASSEPDQRGRALDFFRTSTRVLHRLGIGTTGSRLSDLHEPLRASVSNVYAKAGHSWSAAWSLEDVRATETLGAVLPDLSTVPETADALLELLFQELTEDAEQPPDRMTIARARLRRLSGRPEAAIELLRVFSTDGEHWRLAEWERTAAEAMTERSLEPVMRLLRTSKAHATPEHLLTVHFWAHATHAKRWTKELIRASTLQREKSRILDPTALRAARALERATTASLPLPARIRGLRAALDEVDEMSDVEMQVLFLAAATRWLLRSKQEGPAALVASRYRALCLSLSEGHTDDLHRLELPIAVDEVEDETDERAIPSAALTLPRELEVARLGLSLAASRVRGRDPATRLGEYADTLSHHVSVLRGPLMKLGQVLSFYGFDLPDEAKAILATLHDAATPAPYAWVERVIREDLGRPVEETFATLEKQPLAAGSIGQVHAATLHDGRSVVVKVQYEAMPANIKRDFRALRLVLPFARALLSHWDWRGIIAELETRMLAECRYDLEAEAQERFRKRFADHPSIRIPQAHLELSTPRVLVSERVFGETFAEFAKSAPVAAREHAARTIVSYVFQTLSLDRYFNSDMHPGNLLFERDLVWFLDFGNVCSQETSEERGWALMVESMLVDDLEMFMRGYRVMGFSSNESMKPQRVYELVRNHLMQSIAFDRSYRIRKEELLRETTTILTSGGAADWQFSVPPRHTFAFRLYYGMFAVLADLDVEVNYHRVCVELLANEVLRHPSS